MTSILITGGLGFVGSAVVAACRERHPEWKLSVLDLRGPRDRVSDITYWTCDITQSMSVDAVVSKVKPTVIVHTAGIVPNLVDRYTGKCREGLAAVNVEGTRSLLTSARRCGVGTFVWTSSCTVVTDDLSRQYPNVDETWPVSSHSLAYGESKAAAERLVLTASDDDMATCALRPSVVFGPRDNQTIPSIHACIAKGETPFIIGDGLNLWDVTFVGNVADAHVLAVENLLSGKSAAGQAIFISNEEPISFRGFCLAVWKEFGHYPPFEVKIPVALAKSAGFVAECITWFTGSSSTLSRGSVKDACQVRYCTGTKARNVLGYQPCVGIEEGIQISCQEYAERLEMNA